MSITLIIMIVSQTLQARYMIIETVSGEESEAVDNKMKNMPEEEGSAVEDVEPLLSEEDITEEKKKMKAFRADYPIDPFNTSKRQL